MEKVISTKHLKWCRNGFRIKVWIRDGEFYTTSYDGSNYHDLINSKVKVNLKDFETECIKTITDMIPDMETLWKNINGTVRVINSKGDATTINCDPRPHLKEYAISLKEQNNEHN